MASRIVARGAVVATVLVGIGLGSYALAHPFLRSDFDAFLLGSLVPGVGGLVVAYAGVELHRRDREAYAPMVLGWIAFGVVVSLVTFAMLFVFEDRHGGTVVHVVHVGTDMATGGAFLGVLVGAYQYRALRRKEELETLSGILDTLRSINHHVATAESPAELESEVCAALTDSEHYSLAWIGEVETDAVVPVAWAGPASSYVSSLRIDLTDEVHAGGPTARAVATRSAVSTRIADADAYGPWRATALEHGLAASLAIPLVHAGRVYGVLNVYTTREDAFEGRERETLAELGHTLGYGLHSLATDRELYEQYEALERQNERLEQFAALVSHDLRNPLTVAEGFVEVAVERGSTAPLSRVADALAEMDELIDTILALAREGHRDVDPHPVDLGTVAQRTWATVDVGEATLQIVDTRTLLADEPHLRRILANLFRNAVEHSATSPRSSPSGDAAERGIPGGDVDLESDHRAVGPGSPTSTSAPTVRIGSTPGGFFVEDDGPGIPASMRETVFAPGVSEAESTGFGLFIVDELADAHGWTVAVAESEAGGARFEFAGVRGEDE